MKNGWLIKTRLKSFAVFAATTTEKKEWISHIERCVRDILTRGSKFPKIFCVTCAIQLIWGVNFCPVNLESWFSWCSSFFIFPGRNINIVLEPATLNFFRRKKACN